MKKIVIEIYKIVDGGICVAADDGKKVYEAIFDVLKSDNKVVLSFYGITRMTTAFLNAAVGQMYGDFDEQYILAHLEPPIHCEPWHLTRLKLVTDTAKMYFKDPQKFESIISKNRGE